MVPSTSVSRHPAATAANSATASEKRPCSETNETCTAPAFCAMKMIKAIRINSELPAAGRATSGW